MQENQKCSICMAVFQETGSVRLWCVGVNMPPEWKPSSNTKQTPGMRIAGECVVVRTPRGAIRKYVRLIGHIQVGVGIAKQV